MCREGRQWKAVVFFNSQERSSRSCFWTALFFLPVDFHHKLIKPWEKEKAERCNCIGNSGCAAELQTREGRKDRNVCTEILKTGLCGKASVLVRSFNMRIQMENSLFQMKALCSVPG